MKLSRRFVLTGTAALVAGAAMPVGPRRAWAVTSLAAGDLRIDSLSDGYLDLPPETAFAAIPEAERPALLAALSIDPAANAHSPLNVTLLRQGGRVVLFDVGSGPDFVPTAGKLAEALSAAGVVPGDVTDVIFTHAHPDHLWGLLDEFDEPLFPDAALRMGQVEFDYWTDPATAEKIGEQWLSFAAGAMRRLSQVGDRVERFADGDEVLPGVRAVMTPGHTPGHMSFAVGTPANGIFVTGDFVTSPIGFARPEIGTGTDSDPAQAAATRAAMLARLADEGWTILGYHMPGGGIGRVERHGGAFRFVEKS